MPAAQSGARGRVRSAAARLGGLLELIERDAAARWWSGSGGRGCSMPARPWGRRRIWSAALRRGAAGGAARRFSSSPRRPGCRSRCALSRDPDGRGSPPGFQGGARAARGDAGGAGRAAANGDRARDGAASAGAGPVGAGRCRAARPGGLRSRAFAAFAAAARLGSASIAGAGRSGGASGGSRIRNDGGRSTTTGGLAVAKGFRAQVATDAGRRRAAAGESRGRAELM